MLLKDTGIVSLLDKLCNRIYVNSPVKHIWEWMDLLNIFPIVKLSSGFWEVVKNTSKLKKKTPQITPLLYQTVPSMGSFRFFHPCECFEFVQPESDRNCWKMKPYFCNWCSAAWELNQTTTICTFLAGGCWNSLWASQRLPPRKLLKRPPPRSLPAQKQVFESCTSDSSGAPASKINHRGHCLFLSADQ